jgi:hypothetical protein
MRYLFALLALLLTPALAHAGILGDIKTAVGAAADGGSLWYGLAGIVLLWVLKTIPNSTIYTFVYTVCERAGVVVTLGLSRFKYTAPFWAKHVEPWAIDFINNTIGAAVNGFIAGLRSDDTPDLADVSSIDTMPNNPANPGQ